MKAMVSLLMFSLLLAGAVHAKSSHKTYFKGSDYELQVYSVKGKEPGKTLLLIGGIQGDEPGGYLSADAYVDMALQKGNLIIVPRANFKSIILGQRGPDGDMNRQFGDNPAPNPMLKVVNKLKELIGQADMFLHLHDGWGFHRPEYIDELRNPSRYGQSLIADTDIFTCDSGEKLHLGDLAKDILQKVNARIARADHHLHYFNTQTDRPDTRHKAMRKTATFYALRRHCTPAYGVEASKNLPSLALKIRYHHLVVNAFMRHLDIIPLSPTVSLKPGKLEFAQLQINGEKSIVHDGEVVDIKPGDTVKVNRMVANRSRGLSCDLLALGDLNDLGQSFKLDQGRRLIFRQEGRMIGEVALRVGAVGQTYAAGKTRVFVLEVNGEKRLVMQNQTLKLTPDDQVIIRASFSDGNNTRSPEINFKGWVPPGVPNIGDDRNYVIRLNSPLQKRFSVNGRGHLYPLVAESPDGKKLGEMYIQLH